MLLHMPYWSSMLCYNAQAKCARGEYQDQTGQTSCKSCTNGESISLQFRRTTKRDICPAGHRSYHVATAPITSQKGQYQDHTRQGYCKWCNKGEYSLQFRRTTKCDMCPACHRCYADLALHRFKFNDQHG